MGLHSHSEGWLAQVAGRKGWFLTKNLGGSMFVKDKHGCELFRSAPREGVDLCVVEPGEALYLPYDWYHATCNLSPLTVSFGGQGDVGDMGGEGQLITAVLDNDEAAVDRLLALPARQRRPLLDARVHSGHSAVHMAITHNRVWALRKLHAAGVDLLAPLHCRTADDESEEAWRRVSSPEKLSCDMLGGSLWFESGPPKAGFHVLYLAVLYGALPVLKFYVESGIATVDTRIPVPGVSGWPGGQCLSGVCLPGDVNIAHVASATGELETLRWALGIDPSIVALEDPRGQLPVSAAAALSLSLWLSDDGLRAAAQIHVWAAESLDPRLLRVLLEEASDADRARQLRARDGYEAADRRGMTALDILLQKQQTRLQMPSGLGKAELVLVEQSLKVLRGATRAVRQSEL